MKFSDFGSLSDKAKQVNFTIFQLLCFTVFSDVVNLVQGFCVMGFFGIYHPEKEEQPKYF